jgi:hypothetical protein
MISSVDGRLTGDMNGGGARVRMSTTNGGVRLSASSAKKTDLVVASNR